MVAPYFDKAEPAALSKHDAVLSRLPRPAWLVNGSLCDDQWELLNVGAGERRREKININFNISISPGQKISDRREGDCLTAKLFVYECLNRSMFSPITMAKIIYDYALFARWRLSKGIEKNSTINTAWWRVLISEMRQAGGLAELAATQVALESVLSEMRHGTRPIPFDPARRRLLTRNLCEQIGIAHVGNLSASQKALLEEFASEKNLTFSLAWQGASETKDREGHSTARVRQFLRSLEVLWELRGSLPDAPVDPPFDGEFTPHGLAENICSKGDGRTKTVSAEQVCYLVDHAIRWVMDYAPDIKTYTKELVRQLKSMPGSDFRNYEISALHASEAIWHRRNDADIVGSPFPIAPMYRRGPETASWEKRLPLRSVLTEYLPAACLIVIAAFSARRHEELDSLKDGCIQFVDGDPVLETWIGKTKQGLGKIPVPSVVVQAIEVLSWISERRRKRTGKKWLLTFDSLWPPGSLAGRESFDLAQIFDRFAEFVKVPLNADLTRWSPLPHQFRRFFGIVYFNHYRFPDLAALSRHYRHNDPDMTRRYITESAHGAFLSDLEVARGSIGRRGGTRAQWLHDFQDESFVFRTERFTAVARGEEKMTGWGGQHLSGLIDNVVAELMDELDLLSAADISEDTLNQVIREFAADKRLEPNPAGHSLCKCTSNPTDLRAALCVGASGRESDMFLSAPNPAKAVDEVCSRCPHNVQTADTQPYWRELKERTSPDATCGFAPLLRALQDERHRMASEHYKRCFGG